MFQQASLMTETLTVRKVSCEYQACGNLAFPKDESVLLYDAGHNWGKLHVTLEEARTLEAKTRGQYESPEWCAAKKHRLTASKFGAIMLRKAALTYKFVDRIFDPKPFTSAATT
jgi:hypothetical protein